MVRDIRRQRRRHDGATVDWLVVRNRISTIDSRNNRMVTAGLTELSFRLGFRSVDGFTEREVYREFFPRGLTALDSLGTARIGTDPSLDQVAARKEVTSLLLQLNLPLDERGRRRAANRAEWQNQAGGHVPTSGIIERQAWKRRCPFIQHANERTGREVGCDIPFAAIPIPARAAASIKLGSSRISGPSIASASRSSKKCRQTDLEDNDTTFVACG
jgi:hypothetical protein